MSRRAAYGVVHTHTGDHPHTLRHIFATDGLNKGIPIQQMKELLGHASINTTMVYYSCTREDLVEATKLIGL